MTDKEPLCMMRSVIRDADIVVLERVGSTADGQTVSFRQGFL